MKEFIKQRLKEEFNFNIVESLLDEDYPLTFNMEHFKTLRSFNQRIQYCEQNLQRISSGSSRIVYKIDNEKVLKLAKNQKGLAQNEVEIEYSSEYLLDGTVAKVFEYDENNLWLEMQLARKCTPTLFKQITNFSFDDFRKAINDYGMQSGNGGSGQKSGLDPKIEEIMWEDEFVRGIFDFIGNYGIPVADLMRLNSYGIVSEKGQNHIVIIDYGLTHGIHASYY